MAKVFVSYSRKDIEFAKRLTGELQKDNLDFWVDWEGIPPTVDWWKQIEKGIEEADAFLFLISPDSAASKVCGQEIDCAVKNGKRLIPLIVRDIKGDEVPSQLGHLNWIFFRETDDFDVAIKKLLTAIHTDYEWVQSHRRLQVKTLEWERNNHENSFLLRGKDLQDAEFQLATNSSKDPYPTDLQREYIFKSRQTTDKQRRTVTSIAVTVAIIMVAVTTLALIQLNISRAQRLGAQSEVAFAEKDYTTALVYAYQSNLIVKNDSANHVLGMLPYQNFATGKALQYLKTPVYSLAWSADGRLASGSGDGTVIIWNLQTGQPAQILKGHTNSVSNMAWSADGRLASGSSENTVIIWDLQSGQPAQTLKGHISSINSVAWSADGRLASGSSDNTVIIWNLQSGQPAQTLKGHTDGVNSVAWSADGRLASGSSDNTVIIWDLQTGQPAQTLKDDSSINSVAWSADERLASGDHHGAVTLWDIQTGQPAKILHGSNISANANSVAWSADGQLAVAYGSLSGYYEPVVILWNIQTGQPVQTLKGHTSDVISVAWSADGRLASGDWGMFWKSVGGGTSVWSSDGGKVIVWDIKTGQSAHTLTTNGGVNSVAWSADGWLASGSNYGKVTVWDIKTEQPAQTLTANSSKDTYIGSVAWSADGWLASGSGDGTVIIWNLQTGQPAQTLKGHGSDVYDIAWSADGRLASSSDDGTVIIWDTQTGQPMLIWDIGKGRPQQTFNKVKYADSKATSIAWSADGHLALGAGDGGTVIILDVQNEQIAQTLKGHTGTVVSVAWSADGRLASGSENSSSDGTKEGMVIIWNLLTGQPAKIMTGIPPVKSVAWSADGRLASGASDGATTLWDIQTGQPAQIIAGVAPVASVAWSVDGRLASGASDGTIKIARADMIQPQPSFCANILRNMTIEEWNKYQGILYGYQPACPDLPQEWIYFLQTWPGHWLALAFFLLILAGLFWLFELLYLVMRSVFRKARKTPSV